MIKKSMQSVRSCEKVKTLDGGTYKVESPYCRHTGDEKSGESRITRKGYSSDRGPEI